MQPREYLDKKYNMLPGVNYTVNYKITDYSTIIHGVTVDEAVKLIEKDMEDNKLFLECFGITGEHYVEEMTYRIWDKHLVVF